MHHTKVRSAWRNTSVENYLALSRIYFPDVA